MSPLSVADALRSLLDAVKDAARKGVEEALASASSHQDATATPLLDKRALAQALSISTAKVDRLTRAGTISFVLVGDVRRYDLAEVRASLAAGVPPAKRGVPASAPAAPTSAVRRLSRRSARLA